MPGRFAAATSLSLRRGLPLFYWWATTECPPAGENAFFARRRAREVQPKRPETLPPAAFNER